MSSAPDVSLDGVTFTHTHVYLKQHVTMETLSTNACVRETRYHGNTGYMHDT